MHNNRNGLTIEYYEEPKKPEWTTVQKVFWGIVSVVLLVLLFTVG